MCWRECNGSHLCRVEYESGGIMYVGRCEIEILFHDCSRVAAIYLVLCHVKAAWQASEVVECACAFKQIEGTLQCGVIYAGSYDRGDFAVDGVVCFGRVDIIAQLGVDVKQTWISAAVD